VLVGNVTLFPGFAVPPVIHVPNQLLSAPLGTDVILECFVEAYPRSINYWVKDKGERTLPGNIQEAFGIARCNGLKFIILNNAL